MWSRCYIWKFFVQLVKQFCCERNTSRRDDVTLSKNLKKFLRRCETQPISRNCGGNETVTWNVCGRVCYTGLRLFFRATCVAKKMARHVTGKCCWHDKISWMFHWWLFIRFSAEVKIFLNETNVLWVEVFPSFKRHVTDFVVPFAFSFVIFSSEYYRLVFCKEAFLSFVVIADFQSALLFFFFLYVIIWHKPGRMYVDLTNLSLHVFVTLKTCQGIQCFFF